MINVVSWWLVVLSSAQQGWIVTNRSCIFLLDTGLTVEHQWLLISILGRIGKKAQPSSLQLILHSQKIGALSLHQAFGTGFIGTCCGSKIKHCNVSWPAEASRGWKTLTLLQSPARIERAIIHGVSWHCQHTNVPMTIRGDQFILGMYSVVAVIAALAVVVVDASESQWWPRDMFFSRIPREKWSVRKWDASTYPKMVLFHKENSPTVVHPTCKTMSELSCMVSNLGDTTGKLWTTRLPPGFRADQVAQVIPGEISGRTTPLLCDAKSLNQGARQLGVCACVCATPPFLNVMVLFLYPRFTTSGCWQVSRLPVCPWSKETPREHRKNKGKGFCWDVLRAFLPLFVGCMGTSTNRGPLDGCPIRLIFWLVLRKAHQSGTLTIRHWSRRVRLLWVTQLFLTNSVITNGEAKRPKCSWTINHELLVLTSRWSL